MTKHSWILLTYHLPTRPSNARVKVWRKLQELGAVSMRNSIYVLPHGPETREDFEWLRKEIMQMKGEASVFLGESLSPGEDKDIVRSFQKARDVDFGRFIEEMSRFQERLKGLLLAGHLKPEALERAERDGRSGLGEWNRLAKIDYFHALQRGKAEAAWNGAKGLLEKVRGLSKVTPEAPPAADPRKYVGRLWVTRKDPKIDRLASAWLVRRFIDKRARFKFVTEPYKPGAGELRFDMFEGEFTHYGDWCSFETLLNRFQLKNPGLAPLAEIIHDIDLKDGKFARMEASGLARMVAGLCAIHPGDQDRVNAGMAVFDVLHEALKSESGKGK
jgi:hypothetical protein